VDSKDDMTFHIFYCSDTKSMWLMAFHTFNISYFKNAVDAATDLAGIAPSAFFFKQLDRKLLIS
jgi:hypothetical protein